jgi:FlaG/FlaF family flagellin (archaellin)
MKTACARAITRALTVVLVVCLVAAFVSPAVGGFPTHLRPQPPTGKLLVQLSHSALPVASIQTAPTALVDLFLEAARVPGAVPILQLICVRLC